METHLCCTSGGAKNIVQTKSWFHYTMFFAPLLVQQKCVCLVHCMEWNFWNLIMLVGANSNSLKNTFQLCDQYNILSLNA